MPAVIFSGSSVKALKEKLKFFTAGSVESGTVDPTSVAVDADAGSLYLNTSNGLVYRKLDAGSSTNWSILGSGADGKNYIVNGGAEANVTGWATYADAASSRPVDGTGGSPTVTWTRSTSTPLSGLGSFLLTKDAANRQGEGVSYDFKIDRADRAKVLTLELDYEVSSGTYSGGSSTTDSDVICYLYRVDSTARLIEPVPFKLMGAVAGQNYKHVCQFQADSDADDYRIMFHVATTSASAWTMKIDNVKVSPLVIPAAPSVGDWVQFTPAFTGAGTVSGEAAEWRRVGDSLQARVYFTTGTPTTTEARMDLPAGLLSAGTDKIPTLRLVGYGGVATAFAGSFTVLAEPNVGYVTFGIQGGANAGLTKADGDVVWGSTLDYAYDFTIPIAGWGSSSDVIGGGDGRTVVARYTSTSTASAGTGTPVVYEAKVIDTHGMVNASTGVITFPVSGKYRISGSFYTSAATYFRIYKNGTFYAQGRSTDTGAELAQGEAILEVVAGDTADIRPSSTETMANTATNSWIEVERISGPEQIQAGELVAARAYLSSATLAVSSGSFTDVAFNSIDYDTHGMINTSTGVVTAPVAGVYEFKSVHRWDTNATGERVLGFEKNSSGNTYESGWAPGAAGIKTRVAGSIQLKLVAGDQVVCQALQSTGGSLNIEGEANGIQTWLEVKRIK